jgi:hypothetical protein
MDVTLKKMEDLGDPIVFEPSAYISSPALNIQAALNYIARRRGLSEDHIAMFTYALDFAHVELAKSDLALAEELPDSQRRSLQLACKQLSRAAADLGQSQLLFDDGLLKCQRFVTEVDIMAEALPATCVAPACMHALSPLTICTFLSDNDSELPPPPCNLDDIKEYSSPFSKHQLFGRLFRHEDVDVLAGDILPPGQYGIGHLNHMLTSHRFIQQWIMCLLTLLKCHSK